MSTLQPLRMGFIGAGANTRERHLPGFRAIPGVELAAVANRTTESGRRVADAFGIARVASHWRAVVEDPGVDAVCVGTWPHLHAEATCAALAAGKHVLTEARMARNVAEAERMLAAARAHPGLVAQIVPAPFTLPFDETIRTLLRDGVLGWLREVHVLHTTPTNADAAAPLSWRQDVDLSGCNTLSLGINYEPLLRWLDQDAEVVAADAAVFTPQRREAGGRLRDVEIPESVTVLGRFAGDCRLVLHVSGVELAPRHEIRLNGARGTLVLDLDRGELRHTPLGGREAVVEIPSERRGGWRVEADFVDSIRTGAPVRLTDFVTGVRYMRFTEAVWRAWSER